MRAGLTGTLLAVAATTLGACTSMGGPPRIVTADGMVTRTQPPRTSATASLSVKFKASALAAATAPTDDAALSKAMRDDGFALIYASCSDYFASAGNDQTWLIVFKDLVTLAAAAGAGALALAESDKSDEIALVAFGSATVQGGIDLYTRNFLFGAENVDAVRTLVTGALAMHQSEIEKREPQTTFRKAVVALEDNQAICSPRHIAGLTREAIKHGDLEPVVTGQGLAQAQDRAVLEKLGDLLNPPGALSADQAGALWWLLKANASPDDRKGEIKTALAGLPEDKNPIDAEGAYKAGWAYEATAKSLLSGLSQATQDGFRKHIDEAHAKPAEPPPATDDAATAPPGAPPRTQRARPMFKLAPEAAGTSVHVSIQAH